MTTNKKMLIATGIVIAVLVIDYIHATNPDENGQLNGSWIGLPWVKRMPASPGFVDASAKTT